MNLQQLEYIIAVDTHRHFVTAAEKCFVTQATLSMMIKKLEEELDVKIFDRSRHPVEPTAPGKKIIKQARVVLGESLKIKELIKDEKEEVSGELHLGIIPTLAAQLLPLFVPGFLRKYPLVKLKVSELTTEQIILQLNTGVLDAALLATPLHIDGLKEIPLFYEQFVVYGSAGEKKILNKKYLLAKDIDVNKLWMLEEGHCLRAQVISFCELKKKEKTFHRLEFEAGSIETLKRMVDSNDGLTILPELAVNDLTQKEKKRVRYFKEPAPVREISLVSNTYYQRKGILKAVQEEILKNIPHELVSNKRKNLIEIDGY